MKNYDIVHLRREYLSAVRAMDSAEKSYTENREPFYHAAKLADAAWESLEEAIRHDSCPKGNRVHQPTEKDLLGNVYCTVCNNLLPTP